MFKHVLAGFVVSWSALVPAGCGTRVPPADGATPAPDAAAPASGARVTLHVEGMARRLNLT
jgi:hypothetical protein